MPARLSANGMKTVRPWLAGIAAAIGIAATLALGAWQLGRAHQKIALHDAIEEQKALPAVDRRLLSTTGNIKELLHRQVVLRGSWLAAHTVFLDNRQMKGRPGFYVVTAFQPEGGTVAVLVQRGWAPRNFIDRQKLPPVETPSGVVEVSGRIALAPAKLYEFDGGSSGPIRQNLDLSAFRTETGLALLDGSVQQTGPASEGLLRDWPEASSGVEKHYGYAFQWWALSGLIAFLYAWFQFIAPRRSRRGFPHG